MIEKSRFERSRGFLDKTYSCLFLAHFLLIMEDNLYDEFGNYIGPEMNDSEEESMSVGDLVGISI